MASQTENHIQLEADMPVNKYKQEVRPNKGISEYFFLKAR
jgi:hypothetical protein